MSSCSRTIYCIYWKDYPFPIELFRQLYWKSTDHVHGFVYELYPPSLVSICLSLHQNNNLSYCNFLWILKQVVLGLQFCYSSKLFWIFYIDTMHFDKSFRISGLIYTKELPGILTEIIFNWLIDVWGDGYLTKWIF